MATLEDYLFVKNTRWIWWGAAAFILALLIFHAGYVLGSRRGAPLGAVRQVRVYGFGMPGMMPQAFISGGHGAAGTIATVTLPTFILKEEDGDIEYVVVSATTTILWHQPGMPPTPTSSGALVPQQHVVILGTPGSGEIQANLIDIR
jgi:hypothetical protein